MKKSNIEGIDVFKKRNFKREIIFFFIVPFFVFSFLLIVNSQNNFHKAKEIAGSEERIVFDDSLKAQIAEKARIVYGRPFYNGEDILNILDSFNKEKLLKFDWKVCFENGRLLFYFMKDKKYFYFDYCINGVDFERLESSLINVSLSRSNNNSFYYLKAKLNYNRPGWKRPMDIMFGFLLSFAVSMVIFFAYFILCDCLERKKYGSFVAKADNLSYIVEHIKKYNKEVCQDFIKKKHVLIEYDIFGRKTYYLHQIEIETE
jgi:hypothetical protein